MPEHPTGDRPKYHSEYYHRRKARDRGDSRSRSPGRGSHRRELNEDGQRRRDRKRSRSHSPHRSLKYSEGRRKEGDGQRAHRDAVLESHRGRSITPRDCRSSPRSTGSSVSTDSRGLAKHSRHSRSHSYERSRTRRRSRSRSHSHDRERSKLKHKEKDHDRKKRHKSKEKKKEKEEKRSILTGKKIKLRVHKDSRDLEMDANREDLLQFLNSTYE